jgi:hypothetical protein
MRGWNESQENMGRRGDALRERSRNQITERGEERELVGHGTVLMILRARQSGR